MIRLIGQDAIAARHQRRDGRQVRGEAGRKQDRGLGLFEGGQIGLEPCVRRTPASQQRARGAAPPFALDALAGRRRPRGSAASPR